MKDLRDRIDHLARNDSVVVKGFDSLRRHLADLETVLDDLQLPLGQEYGPMTSYWLEYLRLALETEVAAARILAAFTSAADTPQTRIALEAIRRCSQAIRILAYRRLECLWEVLELRKGTRDQADLAEQLLDELARCPAIH
jgi:hypothetical protein